MCVVVGILDDKVDDFEVLEDEAQRAVGLRCSRVFPEGEHAEQSRNQSRGIRDPVEQATVGSIGHLVKGNLQLYGARCGWSRRNFYGRQTDVLEDFVFVNEAIVDRLCFGRINDGRSCVCQLVSACVNHHFSLCTDLGSAPRELRRTCWYPCWHVWPSWQSYRCEQ